MVRVSQNAKGFKRPAIEFALYLEHLESYPTGRHKQGIKKGCQQRGGMSKVVF